MSSHFVSDGTTPYFWQISEDSSVGHISKTPNLENGAFRWNSGKGDPVAWITHTLEHKSRPYKKTANSGRLLWPSTQKFKKFSKKKNFKILHFIIILPKKSSTYFES